MVSHICLDEAPATGENFKEKLTELKKENNRIANFYLVLSQKALNQNDTKLAKKYKAKAEKLQGCSSIFQVATNTDTGEQFINTFFCKQRFCPVCIAKSSLQVFKLVCDIVNHPQAQGYSYLFMTLTVKNCKAEDLSDTITLLMTAYNKLVHSKRSQFSKRFLGTFKVLESTYNYKNKTYHPHLHILIMIDKSYYKDMKYLDQKELVKLWRQALNANYDPSVDIRKTYNASGKTVAEVSKYTVKSSEINNAEVLETYDNSFYHRRLRSFTGKFRELKNIVLDDWEKTSKRRPTFGEIQASNKFVKNLYRWDYFKKQFELTAPASEGNYELVEDALLASDSDIQELKNL